MKKHFIITVVSIFISFAASSQTGYWFSIDKMEYFKLTGCNPNSDIHFYSERGGGNFLTGEVADVNGDLQITWTGTVKPAFALNYEHTNSTGHKGTGKVHFFDKKEFSLKDLRLSASGNIINLEWQFESNEDFYFEVEITQSCESETIGKLVSMPAGKNYVFPIGQAHKNGNVSLLIYHKEKGIRYKSQQFKIGTFGATIYPTLTDDKFQLMINNLSNNLSMAIVNASGQVIHKEDLQVKEKTFSLQPFANGTYIVVLSDGIQTESFSVIKK